MQLQLEEKYSKDAMTHEKGAFNWSFFLSSPQKPHVITKTSFNKFSEWEFKNLIWIPLKNFKVNVTQSESKLIKINNLIKSERSFEILKSLDITICVGFTFSLGVKKTYI